MVVRSHASIAGAHHRLTSPRCVAWHLLIEKRIDVRPPRCLTFRKSPRIFPAVVLLPFPPQGIRPLQSRLASAAIRIPLPSGW
jgi:hypothetical protein